MSGRERLTLEVFVQRANKMHKNKYTYGRAVWKGSQEKLLITCPEHGDFLQKASPHLRGKGCKRCACLKINSDLRESTASIKKKLKALHPTLKFPEPHNITTTNIKFVCKEHGEGEMKLGYLLTGKRCKKCASAKRGQNQALSVKDFIRRALEVHPSYIFKNIEYVNAHTHVGIECPEHGIFTITPWNLLQGRRCPNCTKTITKIKNKVFTLDSKAEETALRLMLKNLKLKPYEVFDRSSGKVPIIHGRFGRFKRYLPDFYVPKQNLIVEVKSVQSFGIAGKFFYEKPETLIRRMQLRAIKVQELGYDFRLIVVRGTKRVRLPNDWIEWKPEDLIASFNKSA